MPSSIFVNDDDDDDKPTKFEFLKCLSLSIPEIEGGPKFRKLATFTRHMLVRNLKKNRSCDPNQPPPPPRANFMSAIVLATVHVLTKLMSSLSTSDHFSGRTNDQRDPPTDRQTDRTISVAPKNRTRPPVVSLPMGRGSCHEHRSSSQAWTIPLTTIRITHIKIGIDKASIASNT